MTLKDLASKLNLPFTGDGNIQILGIADIESLKPEEAPKKDYLYFVERSMLLKKFSKINEATVVFTLDNLYENFKNSIYASEKEMRLKLIDILSYFSLKPKVFNAPKNNFIHETAKIDPNAIIMPGAIVLENVTIGANSTIYPNAVLEPNVMIGNNTTIYSNVSIAYNCIIGNYCNIYHNTSIGSDGFGYHDQDGKRYQVPQIGNVIIKDYVDIGSNSSIDRATIDSTIISEYTKIDNQVQIGHNCKIGRYVYIAGNAGISGSVTIEDGAIIAGQAGIADHVVIARESIILALTGVPRDTKPKTAYFGIPARPIKESHKINAALGKLPNLIQQVNNLEKKINS